MPAPSLQQEVEELVLEQIRAFKQSRNMDEGDIFEFHLRHYQIMALYREMDRVTRPDRALRKGWLPSPADCTDSSFNGAQELHTPLVRPTLLCRFHAIRV